jgi:hypothetical protein
MIIGNLNAFWTLRGPNKTDAKLLIDSNTMLTQAIPIECFQPIPWWDLQ